MYLSTLRIENFRCFGEADEALELSLKPGLTALIGANDAGKTAIIDAIRLALGTTDQDRFRLEDTDFHKGTSEIRITCKFAGLTDAELRTFVEYLTYPEQAAEPPTLYVHWTAENTGETHKGRPYRRIETCSGKDGTGALFSSDARVLLQATYLRPLRDAQDALSARKGSRLAQVLRQSAEIKTGSDTFDPAVPLDQQQLSVLGITDLLNKLLGSQKGVDQTREKINDTLKKIALRGETLNSAIRVSGADDGDDARLRELLEKLDLHLSGDGRLGLGSDNLLFMACELLLLSQEKLGTKLLLIEEPEAHLHAQRQLQVMKTLQDMATKDGIQVLVTTHSPHLSSAIHVQNIVMVCKRCAFSLDEGKTALETSDYRFLQRFLDSTKANLFFARGVLIVEGDAENILLPTIARLIGLDLTEHGASIVNVGGIGLRRYARIFQRAKPEDDGELGIPVACVTDLDVWPDCAPVALGVVKVGEALPTKRRWKRRADFVAPDTVEAYLASKCGAVDGQSVKTFVAAEWTLEYDLAVGPRDANKAFTGGLAEEVFVAAVLAYRDDDLCTKKRTSDEVLKEAADKWTKLKAKAVAREGCTAEEDLGCLIYDWFYGGASSKAIAAQHLANVLSERYSKKGPELRKKLPSYLVAAIEHVTGTKAAGQ